MAINTNASQGSINELRQAVAQRWRNLTEDDLQALEGDIRGLVERIQQASGESRDVIERSFLELVTRWSSAMGDLSCEASRYARRARSQLTEDVRHAADLARVRYDQVQELVRTNPAQAVAAAFGFGLVAGLIVASALRGR